MRVTLFHIGPARISMNVLSALPMLLALLFGAGRLLLLTLVSLSLHEAAHAFAAIRMGFSVEEAELTPVGFTVRLLDARGLGRDELAVIAAGPIMSLLAGLCCYALSTSGLILGDAPLEYAKVNLTLGFINLLPALPLDGGRLVRIVLSGMLREKTANLIACLLGVVISIALGVYFAFMLARGQAQYFALVFALLLLPSAVSEYKNYGERRIEAASKLNQRVRAGRPLGVKTYALYADVLAIKALRELPASSHARVIVLGHDMREAGSLTTEEILIGMSKKGNTVTLGELIDQQRTR